MKILLLLTVLFLIFKTIFSSNNPKPINTTKINYSGTEQESTYSKYESYTSAPFVTEPFEKEMQEYMGTQIGMDNPQWAKNSLNN